MRAKRLCLETSPGRDVSSLTVSLHADSSIADCGREPAAHRTATAGKNKIDAEQRSAAVPIEVIQIQSDGRASSSGVSSASDHHVRNTDVAGSTHLVCVHVIVARRQTSPLPW
jgi:hypothetical protein